MSRALAAIRAWLVARSARERRMLAIAAPLAVVTIGAVGVLAMVRDLHALQGRVAARREELRDVRRLANLLGHGGARPPDDASLAARLEAAALATVGRERIAALAPGEPADGRDRAGLRVAAVDLGRAIALLHAIEADGPFVRVDRLELARPAGSGSLDVTIDVSARGTR